MYAEVTGCNVRQIDDDLTIRCELMAMKQKDCGFVVRISELGIKIRRKQCCCDTFFRWYQDEMVRLAARQSSSKIDASETPRLRLFEEGRLWLEDGGVTIKRLEQV